MPHIDCAAIILHLAKGGNVPYRDCAVIILHLAKGGNVPYSDCVAIVLHLATQTQTQTRHVLTSNLV